MIIVTGATGQLGSQVVSHLLERVPADQVGVSVRDPERARDMAARGVRVRPGDFTDPGTLEAAFEGATQVLVISVNVLGEEGVRQSLNAIDAAYDAGAQRVLYTSHQAASPQTAFAPGRDHAAVEAHLQRGGRPFTSLRNGYYSTTSLRAQVAQAADSGELVASADGPVSWTAPADLAEGAAVVLAGEARFDGPTPPLTAAEAVDLQRVAELLSHVLGRTIRRVVVDDEQYVAQLVDRGAPEPLARMFLGSFLASRRGDFAVTDPTLARLIGHAPQPVDAALEAMFAQ